MLKAIKGISSFKIKQQAGNLLEVNHSGTVVLPVRKASGDVPKPSNVKFKTPYIISGNIRIFMFIDF